MSDDINVTVEDSTPLEITVAGDAVITVSNSDAKEGYIREAFTGKTGANNVLVFGNVFRTNSLSVFLNGALMEKDVAYTEGTNRDRVTIITSLQPSDKIDVRYVVN